jgi:hypothetical protein
MVCNAKLETYQGDTSELWINYELLVNADTTILYLSTY